jgi:hypothetical protein
LPIGTRRPASSRGEVLAEHAVIVHLTLAGGEMGSPDERAEIATLQEEVSAVIDAVGVGEFDGDEWGGNECVLYMYGEDADRLFDAVRPVLLKLPPRSGSYAIKRQGDAGDANAKEERVSLGS